MWRIVICTWGIMWLFLGCATFNSKEEIVYEKGKLQKFSYLNESQGSLKSDANGGAFMDAVEVLQKADPAAMPQLADLPRFQQNKGASVCTYTGVIKNTTRHQVDIPSLNSGATLQIPPHGWIEYIAYTKNFDVTVYSDGKPFYCLKICVDPKNFQYMCKQYDFMAEIVKPESTENLKIRKKRIRKKPKCEEGLS